MTMIKEVNLETNQIIEREMTKVELDLVKKDAAESLARVEAETAKAEAKSALLAKLGITEDEAKLLLS